MAHPILVPPLGQTTDTVILSAWYKIPGQPVSVGEPLFAIETDKATLDIEAQDAGILAQIDAQAGEEVKVLSAIGLIAAPGESVSARPPEQGKPGDGESVSQGALEQGKPSAAEHETIHAVNPELVSKSTGEPLRVDPPTQRNLAESERVFISPRARRLALAENVRWQNVAGSGPAGAIVERDIVQYLAQINLRHQELTAEAPTYPVNPARAADTLIAQADMNALIRLCERYAQLDVTVSLESVLVYILAQVAQTLPQDALAPMSLSIGYVTPGQGGFVMPVVENLQAKGLQSLTREISELAARAQTGNVQRTAQHEPSMGIAGLAALGIDLFTPVVETPGTPMLGVGRVQQRHSNERTAWFSLNYSGTRLDALAAARLLQQIISRVEDPDLLF
ncbi:MAG TPA: 2-oxo acid dehydrogenase subunit E2 [Anaerolineae bacterium]